MSGNHTVIFYKSSLMLSSAKVINNNFRDIRNTIFIVNILHDSNLSQKVRCHFHDHDDYSITLRYLSYSFSLSCYK